ncbi:MAG: molecular chaperone HtpG [Cytophagaceae bacterium]|nr:molecular chaperone HtpG [Cytophagaceae bacterium]MDW8455213.1 molecular chaperone HtpG [Cytophagaceae bacterium]
MQEKGTISIHTENIFPIIKKFLYSDHEIFLRELVSNAVDATQKLQKLASIGEFSGELGDLTIKISINEKLKTITISDKGIGMTADEIKKYINQIAFSGATEFLNKYKDKGEDTQIIGHFGLGFYSSFMVSKKVEIHTLSYQQGAEAARWSCDGSTEFEITKDVKKERGTDVVLHIAEDSEEFLDKYRIKSILEKYCRFLPVPIEFDGKVINNTHPIWRKSPAELKEEDYKNFYKELYPFSDEPLFWIHLNVDHPFNLTGILYFPKIKSDFEVQKNKIQLYSRQVFITDEVKDVVPEFLMLLHGVIDSPDIPLNVSRSFLQSDSNVKKINAHITKKVADKLSELYNNDPKSYQEKWDHISIFVKYGMLSDDKFYEKAKSFCLLKNIKNEYTVLEQYKDKIKDLQTEKNGTVVALYTNDAEKHHMFIQSAEKKGYDVLLLNTLIDPHFAGFIEHKIEKFSLKRIDSDTIEKLIEKEIKPESLLSKEQENQLKEIFEKAINNTNMKVEMVPLTADEMPVTVTIPEFMRRMKDMSRTGGNMNFMGTLPDVYTVSINTNHALMNKILSLNADEDKIRLAKQSFDLALLSQGMLSGKDLTDFIKRSVEITLN